MVAQYNPETIFASYPSLLSEALEVARSKNEISKTVCPISSPVFMAISELVRRRTASLARALTEMPLSPALSVLLCVGLPTGGSRNGMPESHWGQRGLQTELLIGKVTLASSGNKAIGSLLSYVLSHAYYTFSLSLEEKVERRSEK